MKLCSQDNSELMDVTALERDGSVLVIHGKVFGAMPMTARLTPQQARAAWQLLTWKLLVFIFTLPLRGSKRN